MTVKTSWGNISGSKMFLNELCILLGNEADREKEKGYNGCALEHIEVQLQIYEALKATGYYKNVS